jgi:membrane protein YdbS with pleckstrin-like domain
MENRLTLPVVFVYTLAVVVTGLWVSDPSWPALTRVQIGLVAVVSVLWTVYFDRAVVPRIVDLETEDDEDDEDGPGAPADAESPAEADRAG